MPTTTMPAARLLALLLILTLTVLALPASAVAGNAEYGRSWRPDATLREGCHDYRFRYRVRPGAVLEGAGEDWFAEFLLVDRRGRGLGNVVRSGGTDPRRGRASFSICSTSTEPGRFRIRGKLSVYHWQELHDSVWMQPARFRLRRR